MARATWSSRSGRHRRCWPSRARTPPGTGYVSGQPIAADVDNDGKPDLIAVLSPGTPQNRATKKRRVAAVSGRSGRELWSRDLGDATSRSDIELIRIGEQPVLAAAHGARWIGLDAATGRPCAGPFDLPAEPIRAPQYADADGDGRPEIIIVAAGAVTGKDEE